MIRWQVAFHAHAAGAEPPASGSRRYWCFEPPIMYCINSC